MKHARLVTLALAAALVAGCGGGSSITREEHDELQQELDAAKEAARKAEEERLAEERRADEAEQQLDQAQDQRDQAQDQRDQAQDQRDQAQEDLADANERADDLEEEAGHTASQLVQANARQVFTGLENPIRNSADDADAGAPMVTPRYGQSASVSTEDPAVTFSSITTSTSNRWRKTSFSNRAYDFTDRLDVYSDAEAPTSSPFTSVYHEATGGNAATAVVVDRYNPDLVAATTVIDDNMVVGSVQISTTGMPADWPDAVSSSFPRSGAPPKDFDQTDRGQHTRAELQDAREAYNTKLASQRTTNADRLPENRLSEAELVEATRTEVGATVTDVLDSGSYRNEDRYPLRYTAEVSGSLGGASGWYTCASDEVAAEPGCRVTNQNDHFRFVGPWVFTPSSASATVRVNDSEFMYFGWWARQSNSDGSWTFQTFHGPTMGDANGNRSTAAEISQLSGTATYTGTAVGQFSFYQPNTAQSDYGEFSAAARLTADFGTRGNADGTVFGTIDDFTALRTGQSYSDWSLTLRSGAITGSGNDPAAAGNDTEGVSWSIEGEANAAPNAGSWEAAFYSNLPDDQRTTVDRNEDAVPTGIAGTFEAEYFHVGKMIGAFGAHKQP